MRRGRGRSALEPPLAGRDGPLAIAKALIHAVGDDRTVRLLTILGPAGVVKSRMVGGWKYVDGVVDEIHWDHARSPALGEGLGFWALAEMVRRRAKIGDGELVRADLRKLDSVLPTLTRHRRARLDRAHLAALLGLGAAPAVGREEAFAAWRTFFERVADQGTTVLVFDDLQHADQDLLDFIEDFAERSTGRPILLLAVGRPELLDRRPGWGSAGATTSSSTSSHCGDQTWPRCYPAWRPVCRRGLPNASWTALQASPSTRSRSCACSAIAATLR